jgi:hypothetical protein
MGKMGHIMTEPKKPELNHQELSLARVPAQRSLEFFKDKKLASQEDLETATQALNLVKKKAKWLEETQAEFTKPHRQAEEVVRGWFRPGLQECKQAEALLKGLVSSYHLEVARVAQARMLEASKAAQAGDGQACVQALAAAPTVEKTQGTSLKKVLKFEVTDPTAVPRELCSPDAAKIQSAMTLGAREIPGVRIWEDFQVAQRTY